MLSELIAARQALNLESVETTAIARRVDVRMRLRGHEYRIVAVNRNFAWIRAISGRRAALLDLTRRSRGDNYPGNILF
jgi:hypothetical protein